ncbi:MAG: CYTH domain-containing protein [Bacteroides sp.]|nr:CYTH domain-containing protein [Bacteroides sp.]
MAKEIERKFLVTGTSYMELAESSHHIRQTYLSTFPDATVRLRISDNDAWLTIKGRNKGAVRDEWEFAIPVSDAEEMAEKLAGGFSIDKTRYVVNIDGWRWEIDRFHGSHEGLTVAEIEMPSADSTPVIPDFIGREVTGDPRYYNSSLSTTPGIPAQEI